MKAFIFFMAALLLLSGCKKMAEAIIDKAGTAEVPGQFVKYTIRSGQHYCDQSAYQAIETTSLRFLVKFDSTAIYQSRSAGNQFDINKLFGFSDNGADHHQYSARFGWRWSGGALRLFAYVYNEGSREEQEITTIPIGLATECQLQVTSNEYLFKVNDALVRMPRKSTTAAAKGYQLYPYFGGDEAAPHDIHIWIQTLSR